MKTEAKNRQPGQKLSALVIGAIIHQCCEILDSSLEEMRTQMGINCYNQVDEKQTIRLKVILKPWLFFASSVVQAIAFCILHQWHISCYYLV